MLRANRSRSLRLNFLFALLGFGLLVATEPTQSQAQIVPNNPLTSGVRIDARGLLATRTPTGDPRLLSKRQIAFNRAMRLARATGDDNQLTYISLPKLFADAKALIDEGKPLPDRLKYLDGMTKLRYIFVFPEKNDLVIAGDAEPYDTEILSRPIGVRTGRPVIQLDDLVVALRAVGPGNIRNRFGCSLDMPEGAMQKVSAIIKNPANRRLSKAKKAALMSEATGNHTCRFFGIQPDSRVALVLVEADYLLKRLAMDIDKPPVAAVRHTKQRRQLQYNGLWFTPSYEPILVSKDGLAFEIRGQSLQLNARGSEFVKTTPTPEAAAYVKNFTKYFPQMAEKIPAFADMWNITDLATLAALIGSDRLHEKVSWNLDWILNKNGYPVQKLTVPRTAETLARYKSSVYVVGGVVLQFGDVVSKNNREVESESTLANRVARPSDGTWKVVK